MAGAHYKLKLIVRLIIYILFLYDHCEQMKIIAFQSFHPQEEDDWKEAMH